MRPVVIGGAHPRSLRRWPRACAIVYGLWLSARIVREGLSGAVGRVDDWQGKDRGSSRVLSPTGQFQHPWLVAWGLRLRYPTGVATTQDMRAHSRAQWSNGGRVSSWRTCAPAPGGHVDAGQGRTAAFLLAVPVSCMLPSCDTLARVPSC